MMQTVNDTAVETGLLCVSYLQKLLDAELGLTKFQARIRALVENSLTMILTLYGWACDKSRI